MLQVVFRKERIPAAYVDKYKELAAGAHLTAPAEQGVWAMIGHLKELSASGELPANAWTRLRDFVASDLNADYSAEEDFRLRIGREIYVRRDQAARILLTVGLDHDLSGLFCLCLSCWPFSLGLW